MGMRMPETCWAVFKRQVINLRSCCILLVNSVKNNITIFNSFCTENATRLHYKDQADSAVQGKNRWDDNYKKHVYTTRGQIAEYFNFTWCGTYRRLPLHIEGFMPFANFAVEFLVFTGVSGLYRSFFFLVFTGVSSFWSLPEFLLSGLYRSFFFPKHSFPFLTL